MKRIKYKAKYIRHIWRVVITEQTHRYCNFGDTNHNGESNNRYFKAINGLVLESSSCPDAASKYDIFVRGYDTQFDNDELLFPTNISFKIFCEAVDEYNKYFER